MGGVPAVRPHHPGSMGRSVSSYKAELCVRKKPWLTVTEVCVPAPSATAEESAESPLCGDSHARLQFDVCRPWTPFTLGAEVTSRFHTRRLNTCTCRRQQQLCSRLERRLYDLLYCPPRCGQTKRSQRQQQRQKRSRNLRTTPDRLKHRLQTNMAVPRGPSACAVSSASLSASSLGHAVVPCKQPSYADWTYSDCHYPRTEGRTSQHC